MKIISTICLSVLMFLGCGKKEKLEVSFWHVMAGAMGDTLDRMIDEYNQTHPEGVVKPVNMGSYDALVQKLMGAVAAGKPPVISQMYESWTDQFLQAGQLVPIAAFANNDTSFAPEKLFRIFLEDNTYDSVLVTLPFNKSVPVFYYNTDMFEAAGISQFPKTWPEFEQVCRKLSQDGNRDGTPDVWATSWAIDVWYFSTMLYQSGGRLFDESNRQVIFNSAEGAAVLAYTVGLVKSKLLYIVPGFQRQDEFLSGRIAMMPGSVSSLSFLRDRVTFRMGIAPMPIWNKKATVIAGTNIGIFSKSTPEQQKAAWGFIKWLISPGNQVRWTIASGYLPLHYDLLEEPAMLKFLEATPGYRAVIDELNFARTEPRNREWFAGRTYLGEAIEAAVRGKYSPKEALDIAAEKTNKEIAREKQ